MSIIGNCVLSYSEEMQPVVIIGMTDGSHVLDWENVKWESKPEGVSHEVYGLALPETAFYSCPLCGSVWSDYRRKENILATVRTAVESGDPWCGWEATTETSGGVVGFTELNELYVSLLRGVF